MWFGLEQRVYRRLCKTYIGNFAMDWSHAVTGPKLGHLRRT